MIFTRKQLRRVIAEEIQTIELGETHKQILKEFKQYVAVYVQQAEKSDDDLIERMLKLLTDASSQELRDEYARDGGIIGYSMESIRRLRGFYGNLNDRFKMLLNIRLKSFDEKINEIPSQVDASVKAIVDQETLIDEIVDRINRKQVGK